MNKINAVIEKKSDYDIFFRAERLGQLITEEEALIAQCELGYDPRGYGFYAFSSFETQNGIFVSRWACGANS